MLSGPIAHYEAIIFPFKQRENWVDEIRKNRRGEALLECGCRDLQNFVPLKSNENISKNHQNQLFTTLEINQRLAIIHRTFIKEKQLNLNENS